MNPRSAIGSKIRKAKKYFDETYQRLKKDISTMFGNAEIESTDIGMDMTGFMMEMPVMSLLQFQEKASSMPAGEIVDSLLKKVHNN